MSTTSIISNGRLTRPGAGAFAVIYGLEALGRALIAVALPVQTLQVVGSDEGVSTLFLVGSVAALAMAFIIPRLTDWLGRVRLCALGIILVVAAAGLFILQELPSQVVAFVLRAGGVAFLYAGLSLFIMEHIRRNDLGRSEPLRMLSVGIAWTIGPLLGVQIEALWGPWAPFVASGIAALALLAYFRFLRFNELPAGPSKARREFENPFANLAGFLAQPRLVLSWAQAIGRTIFWASFIIYTPLYAVDTALGAGVGGLLVALGSAFMLLVPFWGWLARRFGIRRVSVIAYSLSAVGMTAAALLSSWPWLGAACLVAGVAAMSVIDGYGNALFFRACKPSQRIAMTPIFAAQRNVADITQAGLFAILLSFFPIQVVFVTLGLMLLALAVLSTRIHYRL
jgi:MFS family permease